MVPKLVLRKTFAQDLQQDWKLATWLLSTDNINGHIGVEIFCCLVIRVNKVLSYCKGFVAKQDSRVLSCKVAHEKTILIICASETTRFPITHYLRNKKPS